MPFHFENKPSLIAYVTCGDPDLATTRELICYFDPVMREEDRVI